MNKRKQFKFSNQLDAEFFTTLRNRVNEYFVENNKEKHGDYRMIIKLIAMLLLYFTPYAFLLFGNIQNTWIYLGLWTLMAFGTVGIGVNVMHDANHGTFTKSRKWNDMIGRLVNLIGGNARCWKLQHNILHHTYTNIDGMDHDIDVPGVLRFSPHQKRYWFHRFQFIYAWFFYGFQTFSWAFVSDITKTMKYRKKGFIRTKEEYRRIMRSIIVWKVVYFIYLIGLPILVGGASWWMVVIGFSVMHTIAGFLLAVIFQTAHVMPECEFPLPNEKGAIENNWAVHQLQTTTNFSPKSRVFSWFVGGLNFQIEHHLFTNISHVHYRDISKIVSKTAKEFGIQYNIKKNFVLAVWSHTKMLKNLGRA